MQTQTVSPPSAAERHVGHPAAQTTGAPPLSLVELALAAAVVLAAFVARAWATGAIGINHYDEGVYVISAVGLAASPPELFPNQIVFSPPFYFATAGLMHWLFGGEADRVAILVNIVIGSLTVGAVWAVGRAWFGRSAALIGAALLAFNPSHILLSRVALTDVSYSFWFVLALGALVLAVDRRDYRIAVLAGLLTGMAWNTKYHGWFVLLITGVALVPELWRMLTKRASARPFGVWLTAAAVACVCYLPWALYMGTASGDGGYGGIVRYFAAMLRGEWFANVMRHAGQQAFMEGALSRAAPLAALGVGLLVGGGTATRRTIAVALGLAAGALLIGQAGVGLVLALFALPILVREFASYRYRAIICWVGLWVVAAPFYHPYARLLLPLMIAVFMLAGLVLQRFLDRNGTASPVSHAGGDLPAERPNSVMPAWAGGMLMLAAASALMLTARQVRDDAGDPWRSTRNVAALAENIAARVPEGQAIRVLGEPPLAYHLRDLGRDVPGDLRPRPLADMEGPAYIVAGVYSQRAPQLRNVLAGFGDRLNVEAVLRFEPNDLRLLDDLEPAEARAYRKQADSTFDLTLYRLDPIR